MLEQKSDTSKKNASSTKNSDAELNKSKRGLVKGPKPLQRLKFYLDIKNHAVTSKLEEKIKDLGGAVEFFLDREVTHVISDRPQCLDNTNLAASSPSTPRLRSVELNTNESPSATCESPATGRLRQKTRADAMLERVRSQSTNKVRDPLQNAKLWGIPIWNVNKILSWLEKVSASITVSTQKKKSVKVINISAPFLKFEPITRDARPVYKTIQSWPLIDLDTNPGKPAFIIKSDESQIQQKSLKSQPKSDQKTTERRVDPDVNENRMTRKQRTRLSVRGAGKEQEDKQALVGGFCEICHCEYREIAEHVRSEQHLNFIKNDANFLELDSLISAGANVEAFLRLNGTSGKDINNYPLFCRRSLRKLNGKSSPEKCNGNLDGYSPPVTRNKMPRTRGSHSSPLSPAGSDTGHHLRSRGQIWLPNNLIGTTAEDDLYVNNKKDKDRSNRSRLTDEEAKNAKENDTDKKSEGRPKRTGPRTKRISADERLVADNKTYYKVEVMTTKLRSSGLGHRETEVARRAQTPIPEEPHSEEQGLVVKFRRVRQSELSALNNEAENFMFPRKDDPSYSDLETDDGPNTTISLDKTETSDIRSSESDVNSKFKQDHDEHLDENSITSSEIEILPRRKRKRTDTYKSGSDEEHENSIDNFVSEIGLRRKSRKSYTEVDEQMDESSKDGSTAGDCDGGPRKRRRTHAEVFISDNQRYYKFETPGSRLRYQGMFFPNSVPKSESPVKNNGECNEPAEETQDDENKPKMPKDDLKFSFELLPKSEPWYQTFKRQDNGDIIYTCTSDPGYCTNFFLPYQLPFIIPLDPQVCINEYHRKKRTYLNPEQETADDKSEAVSNEKTEHIPDQQDSIIENSFLDIAVESSSATSLTASETNLEQNNKPHAGRRKKRKSRFLKMSQMHPRKSPRQHASTLAILSSLIQQRKKRERKSHGDSDTSRASLPSIPEEEDETLNVSRLSEEEKQLQEKEQAELSKTIENILNTSMDDLIHADQPPDILEDDIERIEIKHNQDCIQLIENFDKEDTSFNPFVKRRGRRGRYPRSLVPKFSPITPLNSNSGSVKNVRRKRKKNRTGWPKKKRLFINKKSDQKDEDSVTSVPELGDSRLTEISMNEENGEVEMCEQSQQELVNSDSVDRTTCEEQENINNETVNEVIVSDKQTEELNENKIQGVSNCTERLNNVNNINNSLENKTNNVLAENLNNNSVRDKVTNEECDDKDVKLNDKNNGVLINNVLVNKITTENLTNDVTVVPDASQKNQHTDTKNKNDLKISLNHIPEKEQSNTMIKVSVSTDFSSNKVPTSPKKSDTVYSVTILDCKKSVVDGKKVDPCEEVGVKDKWENTEKVMQYQPFVRVQKIESAAASALQNANRRLRSSASPSPERKPKVKRAKIVPPTSPRSPRKLRVPRGKWYRER